MAATRDQEPGLRLDRARRRLLDGSGAWFDPKTRRWETTDPAPKDARAIVPADAVRWLQNESSHPLKAPVGVVGARQASRRQLDLAEEIGQGIATLGLTLLCGGREGIMSAACKGAAGAGGLTVGLLPDDHWDTANPFVAVPLATGIGVARNALIARAAFCLVAVGGGHGTLSEIAFALQFGRPVFRLGDAPVVDGAVELDGWTELEPALCHLVLGL